MDDTNCEVSLGHTLPKLNDLLFSVGVDYCLLYIDVVVQVGKGFELVQLLLDCDVVLVDPLKAQLFFINQNLIWVAHELIGHLEHVIWHGSRKQPNLYIPWHRLENVKNLVLKSHRQHLISLVEDKDPQRRCVDMAALYHVINTTWSADYYMYSLVQRLDVSRHWCTTDAHVGTNSEVMTEL